MSESEGLAKLFLALAGGVWGLYWLPLRAMDERGVTGTWATFMFLLIPAIVLLPFYLLRWRKLVAGGGSLLLTATVTAFALVFYSSSLILTEIVHAIVLFYLTPIWSSLLGRIVLGEQITRLRVLSIGLGFAGMGVVLGLERGIPLPQNLGDWMALAAGIFWAVTAVRLRLDKVNAAEEHTLMFFLMGVIVAFAFTYLPDGRTGAAPPISLVVGILPWLVPTIVLVVMTSTFLMFWGARLVDPGLVGVLFLTEITVATITAALFAGEPFGWRELIGVVLISAAGLAEVVYPRIHARLRSTGCGRRPG